MINKRSSLADDLRVSGARGVLAKLFRTIAEGVGMDAALWEDLLQRVLDHPRNPAPRNSKDRSSIKGNLNKALKGARMSWKVFEKALSFLGVVEMRLSIQCKWPNGKVTENFVTRRFEGLSYEQLAGDKSEMNGFKIEENPPHLVRSTIQRPSVIVDDADRLAIAEHIKRNTASIAKGTPPDVQH